MVVVVVVMVAGAIGIVTLVVVQLLMLHDLLQLMDEVGAGALHGREDLLAVHLLPRGRDDGGGGVVLAQQRDRGVDLLLAELARAGEDDAARVLDLIVEELTEVLHVDLALAGVGNGDEAVEDDLLVLLRHVLHRADHVGELAHAARLDDDAVRVVLRLHVLERLAEVADEGAADAAAGHFADLHAGALQKAAVDADLAELIFDQDDLLALVSLLQQLLDERGLACAQKAGDDVNFCHVVRFLCF